MIRVVKILPPPTMATLHSIEGTMVGGGCVVVGAVVSGAPVVDGGLVVAFVVV